MSAVRTPRALGRSVGLSAARPPGAAARNCSGQSAACAPWASMAFTRKRLREQQLQLYSKERCAGREAGKGGSRGLSCRSRPPPGPQSRGWARLAGDTRDAKAGPFPCSPAGPPARPHARRPQPASPHRPSAPCSRPAWEAGGEAACGRAVAVSRGPGRTWVELRPPSDPVPSQESGLPPSVSFPGLLRQRVIPAVVPTGTRATLIFLEIRGLLVGAGIGLWRCRSVEPAKQFMPGHAGAAFILGGFVEGVLTCNSYSTCPRPPSEHLPLGCSGQARWSVLK